MEAACIFSNDFKKSKCDTWDGIIGCIYFPLPMGFKYKPRWKIHLWLLRKRGHSEAGKTNCVINDAKKKKRWQFQITHDHELSWYMVMKTTNAYKRLGISNVIYVVCLLHVSATLVTTVRDVHYKGNIKVFETMHKCQIGSKVLYRIFRSALPWGWTRV